MNDQELNIIFVGEVEKHPVLYNHQLPEYSRKDITEKAWKEVAAIMNMSAAECREKWRNLRTVLLRKIKPQKNGKKKKAYYLAEAMRFCIPYIKVLAPISSQNSPQVPHEVEQKPYIKGLAPISSDYSPQVPLKVEKEPELVNDIDSLEDSTEVNLPKVPPLAPISTYPESPGLQRTTLPPSQIITHHPVQSSITGNKRHLVLNDESAVVDKCVAEYLKAKKAKIETTVTEAVTSSHSIDRKEAIRMFLLSLIPELVELSDSQIKVFKRRVFSVLDEIAFSDT